jgi:hypothetical protein
MTSDPVFMYAEARMRAGLGMLKEAQTTLRVIAAKKPEVRSTPAFHRAVDFVVEQTQKAGSQAR